MGTQFFRAGFFGGTCPTIAKVAGAFAVGQIPPMPAALSGLAFGVLGGLVAHYISEKNNKDAFIAGIAAPAIVAGILSGATDDSSGRSKPTGLQTSTIEFLVSAAHAEEGLARELPNQTLNLHTSLKGGNDRKTQISIVAYASSGLSADIGAIGLDNGSNEFPLPEWAETVTIEADGFGSKSFDLTETKDLYIKADTVPTFWGGVLWGLGGEQTYRVESLEITPRAAE